MMSYAYVKITGRNQGALEGDVDQKGREGMSHVTYFVSEVITPLDVASGRTTGRRQHKTLLFTKPVDKSTPLISAMLCTNEEASKVKFDFWRPLNAIGRGGGTAELYLTIELENAVVVSQKIVYKDSDEQGATDHFTNAVEHLGMSYSKIVWTHTDGGQSAEDNWQDVK